MTHGYLRFGRRDLQVSSIPASNYPIQTIGVPTSIPACEVLPFSPWRDSLRRSRTFAASAGLKIKACPSCSPSSWKFNAFPCLRFRFSSNTAFRKPSFSLRRSWLSIASFSPARTKIAAYYQHNLQHVSAAYVRRNARVDLSVSADSVDTGPGVLFRFLIFASMRSGFKGQMPAASHALRIFFAVNARSQASWKNFQKWRLEILTSPWYSERNWSICCE